MKISILGNGAFGSGMGSYLSSLGHQIIIDKIEDSQILLVAVPSNAVLPVLLNYKNEIKDQHIVICSKGLSEDGKLLSEVLNNHFENEQIYFLYGPTLIKGISNGELSGAVLCGGLDKEKIKNVFSSPSFIVEISDDIIGVQVGACLKNVVAILIGIVDGRNFGENTKAYFFAKGLEEIANFGFMLGAKKETFLGLSCAGDLFLNSRNRVLGFRIGKGEKLDDIISDMGYHPEGLDTLKELMRIIKEKQIKSPLFEKLFKIIFENSPIEILLEN